MASFSTFLKSIYRVGNDGKQFERFVKWFLKNDPVWSKQVEKVWLWDEYPDRWGIDKGIDLVFKHTNGENWAVQAKCYDPKYSITKGGDLDTFLSESGRKKIDRRLLITTTDRIGANAKETCAGQEKPVTLYMRADFEKAEIDYPKNYKSLWSTKKRQKPSPKGKYSYQEDAIRAVVEGFKNADRGQLIMACGTGKTLTTLWVKERLKSQSTLVLVPSLNLLSQTLKEWTFASKRSFSFRCVCSDKTVGRRRTEDEVIENVSDLAFPVINDPQDIAKFMKGNGDKVVFSTYHSSPLVAAAQRKHGVPQFDLVVADEAHRCANIGEKDTAFRTVLNAKKLRAKRRLFATATPRTYSSGTRKAAENRGADVVSMDDKSVFGREFYKLSFGEAIGRKPALLTDYQVVIMGVDDDMIANSIINREFVTTKSRKLETDAETLAAQVGLLKAIRKYEVKRLISFHNRVKRAQIFAETITKTSEIMSKRHLPKDPIWADYVEGKMSTFDRGEKIKKLKHSGSRNIGLLANAQCLGEGVDVPSLDGVAFIDPKSSQIDIIQAVGRAIRLSKTKKVGTIVLPIFLQKGENAEERIENSNFKGIWSVLNALKSHDDVLNLELGELRTEMGRRGRRNIGAGKFTKIVFDLPTTVSSGFANALRTNLIECTTQSWSYWFGVLERYASENGHCAVPQGWKENPKLARWVANQRSLHKADHLDADRFRRLDALGFVWNPHDVAWEQMFAALAAYKNKFGDCEVGSENKALYAWNDRQRSLREANRPDTDRIRRLDELGFIWDWNPSDAAWEEMFAALGAYNNRFGNCLVPQAWQENPKLGKWGTHQRELHKADRLDADRFRRLDELGFSWDPPTELRWSEMYEELRTFNLLHGHCNISTRDPNRRLARWVVKQRTAFRNKKMGQRRIPLLEALGFEFERNEFSRRGMEFRNFLDAKKYVRSFKYKSKDEFLAHARGHNSDLPPFPTDIPRRADLAYKDKGWLGWKDFIGLTPGQ